MQHAPISLDWLTMFPDLELLEHPAKAVSTICAHR